MTDLGFVHSTTLFDSLPVQRDILDQEKELTYSITVPSFRSFSRQAAEFVKGELWCNYWRNKSQKREGLRRRWIERDADKEEWRFNLQKNETKNIYVYVFYKA